MRLKKAIYTDKEVDSELINKLIQEHNTDRFKVLQGYYEGYHKSIEERPDSNSRPNNKLSNSYPSYIVDMMTGYSTGNPINYTSSDDKFMESLQEVFDLNDEQDQNSALSKDCGIKGVAYEVIYTDENADIRFDILDVEEVIPVYDTKLDPGLRFVIRVYSVDSKQYVVLYTKTSVIKYDNTKGGMIEIENNLHNLDEVPIVQYINNSDLIGDFEPTLSLIDAYDKIQSDSLNDAEQFADAYLVLENAQGTDEEDLDDMRSMRAIMPPEGSKAYYLTKDINDTALENIKNRLNKDIHKFSGVIDVGDESTFGGNQSGVAFKYKLIALENKVANKERKFKKSLQSRIRLITKYLNLKGGKFDYTDVKIQFQRNLPEDETVEIDNAIKLMGIVSEKTALSTLSMVEDAQYEIELKNQEQESYTDDLYNEPTINDKVEEAII